MSQYKIILIDPDGCEEEQDEVFASESAAEDYAIYLCGCARQGAEVLHMSNPGDYPYDEDESDDWDYEIVEED